MFLPASTHAPLLQQMRIIWGRINSEMFRGGGSASIDLVGPTNPEMLGGGGSAVKFFGVDEPFKNLRGAATAEMLDPLSI